jgi:hypothetical protein
VQAPTTTTTPSPTNSQQPTHLLEDVLEHRVVVERGLGLAADLGHDLDRLDGEPARSGLAREHDAVGAVEHGVCDVGRLGARRPRVLDHRLEHLRRRDDRLARVVALLDHHLLCEEDLLGRNLHTQEEDQGRRGREGRERETRV